MSKYYLIFFSFCSWFLLPFVIAAQPQKTLVVAGQAGGANGDESSTFSILPDGSLWGWGANSTGQLGDGTTSFRQVPYQVGAASKWRSVAAGRQHTVAVRADGTLWSWGDNTSGQLGTGTTLPSLVPIQVGTDSNWASVAAGASFTVALRQDHTLWTWGTNNSGQLGDGTLANRAVPMQIGTDQSWERIVVGRDHSLAIRRDGTLWAWGENFYGQLGVNSVNDWRTSPTQVGTATNWVSIGSGETHSAAVRADGSLWTWGINQYGQLGTGTISANFSGVPAQVGTDNTWASVAAGRGYTLALRRNGTLWSWGANGLGQLGHGSRDVKDIRNAYLRPTQVGNAATWASVAAGSLHALASRLDGSVWAWGPNNVGQVGSAELTPLVVSMPRQIGSSLNWRKASASTFLTLALRQDGTLWAWGSNQFGQLGDGTTDDQARPVPVGTATTWSDISVSNYHVAGIQSDGSLWSWGDNYYGELGDGTTLTTGTTRPTQVGSVMSWSAVAAGDRFTMALRRDGTLWGWGLNSSGQLGDGTTIDRAAPVQVPTPALAALGTTWQQVAVGHDFTLALRSDNTLWAWGSNWDYQLGDGSFNSRSTPVQVDASTNWLQVAGGQWHTEAIRSDGTLWGWGGGTRGLAGTGTSYDNQRPRQVGQATTWRYVAAGTYNTAAIRADGTMWTWGSGANGQLGDGTRLADGTNATREVPTQMGTATTWRHVEVSLGHSVAVRTDGSLWAWGLNKQGQVGIPAYTATPLLIQFGGTGLAATPRNNGKQLLTAYPNPAQTRVRIDRKQDGLPVVLVDLLGQEVRRLAPGASSLSLQGLAPGLYLLRHDGQSTRLGIE